MLFPRKKIGKTDAINCVANHFDFTLCCIYCVMELSEIIFLLLIHFVFILFSLLVYTYFIVNFFPDCIGRSVLPPKENNSQRSEGRESSTRQ